MDHYEMVEKLREKANVSYEEAKAALEATDWNLLDALVLLENQGKVTGSQAYSTKTESSASENRNRYADTAARVGRRIASGINRANGYTVVFSRKGETLFELPLLVPVLLLIFGFWVVVPLLIAGLFFGFKYELKGAAGVEAVNRVMDKASEVADNIVSEVRKEAGKDDE
jgi:hypothetical protein